MGSGEAKTRVKVTRKKSNDFKYSAPQMLQALYELVKDKLIVKCYDKDGKLLGTGFIRKLYPEQREILLSISAPCSEIELSLEK